MPSAASRKNGSRARTEDREARVQAILDAALDVFAEKGFAASRFPALAEFYHREVVSRGMGLLREVAERAAARGEFQGDELARFPQLAIAPGLVAILWSWLFERFEPLDQEGLLDAHLAVLMRALKGRDAGKADDP